MLDFLNKYKLLLFICLPAWFVVGNSAGTLNFVVVGSCIAFFAFRKWTDFVLVSFIIILVLSDSRVSALQWAKPQRVLILVLMAFFSLNDLYRGIYSLNRNFIWLLPYFIVAMFALNASPTFTTSFSKAISFLLLFFAGFHYIRFYLVNNGGIIVRDIIYLSQLIFIVGLGLMFVNSSLVFYKQGFRFNGLLGNPNGMGLFITMVFPLHLYYFHNTKNVPTSTKIASYFLVILSLLLCSSRNALFSFSIFVLLFQALQGSIVRRVVFLFGIIPILGLTIYGISLENLAVNMGVDRYLRVQDFDSGSGRVYAWQHALTLIEEQPVIGCGFACEEWNYAHNMPIRLIITGHQGGVHNSYLAIIINTGYVGLIFYLLFILLLLRKIRDYKFLIPYLFSVLFSAFFESWMAASLNAFTIFFMIMLIILMEKDTQKLFKIE